MVYGMEREEIIDLAHFALEHQAPINSWQVTMKENITKQKAEDIVADFKYSSLDSRIENENVIKYIFGDVHKVEGIDVTYNVVIPQNEAFKPELIVVIEGTKWNENIEEAYVLRKEMIKDRFFTKSLKLFACLTVQQGGIMSSDVFMDDITKYFNVKHSTTQIDTIENSMHKKIIYGYTDLWKQNFMIQGTQMNLQIAIVADEEMNTTYTIGTPILIHEY